MANPNPKVDFFFREAQTWQEEFTKLREMILDCGLTEELKWGQPCYTLDDSNIVLMHGFKEYCALLFMKGALLQDPNDILIQQTENVQAARQIRFTDVQQIMVLEPALKSYVYNAIEVEKAGLEVEMKKTEDFPIPDEFVDMLEEVPGLQDAFEALTPGRQRGYLLHFAAPKQSKTRTSRIEKAMPRIFEGKGLHDR